MAPQSTSRSNEYILVTSGDLRESANVVLQESAAVDAVLSEHK
jgi:hypothetical protein